MGGEYPIVPPSQILKHRIFTPLYDSSVNHERFSPEQWLYRNDRVRNHSCNLMWCAARISQINDDEAGQVCKRADRFCQVSTARFVKAEQNRDVPVCAKGFSEGIKDSFALGGEAAKNEDGFSGNGVDHVTNFWVVQQQVNELSDLKIVNGNGWFPRRSNDQVVLCCLFHFHIPGCYAINVAASEARFCKIGFHQHSSAETGTAEIGFD